MRYWRFRRSTALYLFGLWAAWFGLTLAFEFLRAVGDEVSPARRIGGIEKALFLGYSPPQLFHDHVYTRDVVWLDYFGFLMHGLWFGVPFAAGLVIMLYRRERLLELFAWYVAATYVAGLFYLVLPVEPPWMEDGLPRLLYVRNFGNYPETIDPNPLAAFPSLHAAIPMVTCLFFLLRGGPKVRFVGWLAGAYALAVGFSVVYLGEHWVVDVAAGYALAGLVAAVFASGAVHRALDSIPGSPLRALARFNARMLPVPHRREPVAVAAREPVEVREAA